MPDECLPPDLQTFCTWFEVSALIRDFKQIKLPADANNLSLTSSQHRFTTSKNTVLDLSSEYCVRNNEQFPIGCDCPLNTSGIDNIRKIRIAHPH